MSRSRASWILPPLLVLSACSWSHNYFSMRSSDALVTGGSGRPTYVAWYRGGEIRGAEAAFDPEFPYRDWIRRNPSDVRDHPDIPRWRRQMRELHDLARSPNAKADEMIQASHGLPFARAVEESMSVWVQDRPEQAAALLDRAEDLLIHDDFAERLAQTALRGETADRRVALWVRGLSAEDHDEAIAALVGHEGAGPQTARAALAELGEASSRMRPGIFTAAAGRLVGDPASAADIVEAADELSSRDEAAALHALLGPDAPPELPRQVLRHLDDRRSTDRPKLFVRAAELSCHDTRAHHAIANALDELPSKNRLDAARAVVTPPDVPVGLVLLLVDRVDDLPSRDREEFLTVVLDGPHGADLAVRDACRDAARRHLRSSAERRVLQRLDR